MRVTVRLVCFVGAMLAGACATQREQRLSSAEARERPTDEPCEPKGKPPGPAARWSCGYWHWDAVRYVWVDGHWQQPPLGQAAP